MIKNNIKIKKSIRFKGVSYLRGTTLLELVIVFAIIGIMSTIAFVSFGSSRTSTSLKAAQREVSSSIQMAQSYALQGKKCPDGSSPASYSFNIENSTSYSVRCNASSDHIEDGKLENGVAFSPNSGSVTFTVPHAKKGGLSTISLQFGGSTKTISINDGGMVTEEN